MSLDLRGADPVLTWQVGGQTILSVTDTSSGSLADLPAGVRLGFGPGAWGATDGTLAFDQLQVTNAPATR